MISGAADDGRYTKTLIRNVDLFPKAIAVNPEFGLE